MFTLSALAAVFATYHDKLRTLRCYIFACSRRSARVVTARPLGDTRRARPTPARCDIIFRASAAVAWVDITCIEVITRDRPLAPCHQVLWHFLLYQFLNYNYHYIYEVIIG